MPSNANASATVKAFPQTQMVLYWLNLFVMFFILVLNVMFLYYVYELEKRGCKCALNWRRQFMEISLILFILLYVVSIFWQSNNPWFSFLVMVLVIAFIIITRQFINLMKHNDCACATKDTIFKVLDIFNILQIFILAIIIIRIVFLLVLSYTITNDMKNKGAISKSK